MAYEFSSTAVRSKATELRAMADDVSYLRTRVLYLLSVAGRYSSSTDALWAIADEARGRAGDLDGRARFIDDYELGWVASAQLSTAVTVRTWADTDDETLVADIEELRHAIDGWSGTDNDPILDEMVRDLHAMEEALGIRPDQLQALAEAMLQGLSPEEAGLSEWLFPPWYLDAVAMHESGTALIADLEARLAALDDERIELTHVLTSPVWTVDQLDRYDGVDINDRYVEVIEEIDRVEGSLELAKQSLVPRPSASAITVASHVAGLPVPYVRKNNAIGDFLAAQFEVATAKRDYETMIDVAVVLADSDTPPLAAVRFFNSIGVDAASEIPDWIASVSWSSDGIYSRRENRMPGDIIFMYSTALAKASRHHGLTFTGAELIDANIHRDVMEREHFTDFDASYLLIAGGFGRNFAVSATAAYLPYALGANAAHDQVFSTTALLPFDSRVFLFEEIVRLGAGTELVLTLEDVGVLVNPDQYYIDDATVDELTQLLAEIGTDVDPTTGLLRHPSALATNLVLGSAADNGSTHGLQEMLALLLAPHIQGLIPGESYDAPSGVVVNNQIDTWSQLTLSDDQLDAVLAQILGHPGGNAAMYQLVFSYAAYELVSTIDGGESTGLITDDLGNLYGRIRAVDLATNSEIAARADADHAFGALLFTTAASLVATAATPPSWPLAAALLISGATAVASGVAVGDSSELEAVLAETIASLPDGANALMYATVTGMVDAGQIPAEIGPPGLPAADADAETWAEWVEAFGEWHSEYLHMVHKDDSLPDIADVPIDDVAVIETWSQKWYRE